jgi:Asp-tRNA(Asn)/Glu-tRNA(Gln) amidotransferase C subunit
MNQDKIKAESKRILDNFAKSLDKIKIPKGKTQKLPLQGLREEKNPKPADNNFRSLFFKNAPHKENDFILAEKKSWK